MFDAMLKTLVKTLDFDKIAKQPDIQQGLQKIGEIAADFREMRNTIRLMNETMNKIRTRLDEEMSDDLSSARALKRLNGGSDGRKSDTV